MAIYKPIALECLLNLDALGYYSECSCFLVLVQNNFSLKLIDKLNCKLNFITLAY